ncbi:MAG: hypothetical protein IJ007_00560 [Oscillospiraceae bacterium]|nr:hypothetical protein [Oscillospiraceae bacterium]
MRLELNPQGRRTRAVLWLTAAVIFPSLLAAGYITVTKNCYNAMNERPITVFAAAENDSGETVLIFLNNEYVIK